MLFNSLEFLVFLPVVFLLYWTLERKSQNVLVLAASYVFYGWWDWRFLGLIAGSSLIDFYVGRRLANTEEAGKRRGLLGISLLVNLGCLGFFKYANFFIDSAQDALETLGFAVHLPTLQILLPVGISFYTFQTLSYTVDIYRKKLEPTDNLIQFLAFVSFFPQLVAGPIERAERLLVQFEQKRVFSYEAAADGCRQMLWGMFKKTVIADRLAVYVANAYSNPNATGPELFVATVFFAFQIYCDFSGYSDIAIGCARLFGFNLMRNFAYPYFATGIGDFWQRWHISLSTWFRDYLYIPLGGGRVGKLKRIRNIVITFTVSGFWHGANWTFIAWGFLHSLFYLPELLLAGKIPDPKNKLARHIKTLSKMAITFLAVVLAWVFFRADSMTHALTILQKIATDDWSMLALPLLPTGLIAALAGWEWLFRDKQYALDVAAWPRPVRWLSYYALVFLMISLGVFTDEPFIYFQF